MHFSKWLFSATAVVGSLGAAFGVSGVGDLGGNGKRLFVGAILSLAVSLALAAISRTPIWTRVYVYSPSSLNAALESIVRTRFWLLVAGSVFFSVALVLAGLAPLFSS